MNEDADPAPIGLLEERLEPRVGQGGAGQVALQNDPVELQHVQGAFQFAERGIGIVHRYRGKSLEPGGECRNQFGVRIVQAGRDRRLVLRAGEIDIGRRHRYNLDIHSHAIHVLNAQFRIGHGRRDTEESGSPVLHQGVARYPRSKRELRSKIPYRVKVVRRIVVSMQVEFHIEINFLVCLWRAILPLTACAVKPRGSVASPWRNRELARIGQKCNW